MHLTWLGKTCVKIQTKPRDGEVVIIIDPYKVEKGEFPRNLAADVALYSNHKENSISLTQDPFIIDTLGEFDIKNNIITTWPSTNDSIIFKVNSEGMNLVHFGATSTVPSAEIIESLGKVDMVFIPVGGNKTYFSPKEAAELITTIEPRIVIPISYQSDTDPDAEPLANFIKEIGLKPSITDKKIIIKQKDLPQDEIALYVLEKNS